MGSIRIKFWRTGSLVALGVASWLVPNDQASAQRSSDAAVYRSAPRDLMPTDHFAVQQAYGDARIRSVRAQPASYLQPQLQLQGESRHTPPRYLQAPLDRANTQSRYAIQPKYRTLQPPSDQRHTKSKNQYRNASWKRPGYRRSQDDPFGEGQVGDVPGASSDRDVPSIFQGDSRPNRRAQENNGVVLPPGILSPKSKPSKPARSNRQGRPRIPGGGVMMPDMTDDQLMPKPSQPNRNDEAHSAAERREDALRAQAKRQRELERRAVQRLEERQLRGFSDGDDDRPRRSRDQRRGNDGSEYSRGDIDVRRSDRTAPETLANSEGPDSWYRPEQGPATGIKEPYGFSSGDRYDPVVAAPVAATTCPVMGTPSALPADSGMYHPALVNAAGGGYGGAQAGCGSCGTGLVNGCYDSVFYLSFFGGYVDLEPMAITDASGQSLFDVDDGYGLGVALGQYQGRNLRTEIEFSYRENDLTGLTVDGNPAFASALIEDGQVRSFTGMANAIWEFAQFPHRQIKPYVGAGFGFVNVQTEASVGGESIIDPATDSDSSFGYQWMAGVNYRATLAMDVFVEYRYLKADSLQLDTTGVSDTPPNGSGGFDYETQNLFGGVRFKF